MTGDEQGQLFKYDAWDRLVAEVTSGGADIIRYTVDGRGYRVQRIAGGQTINYFYNEDWQLVEEKVNLGAVQATYVWGLGYPDALVARDAVGHGRQYAQHDANYNVTSVANTAGTAQERYVYTPYGERLFKTGTWGVRASSLYAWVVGHQGGLLDSGTGLYHFRNRDYSPTLGRWNRTDPLGYIDGLNLYWYVQNAPVGSTDPYGESTRCGSYWMSSECRPCECKLYIWAQAGGGDGDSPDPDEGQWVEFATLWTGYSSQAQCKAAQDAFEEYHDADGSPGGQLVVCYCLQKPGW